jgi:pseudaminic acid cytidylyltransferase
MKTTETVALIPARTGSKRIPNKNLAEIDGKPALSRAIELVISSGIFTKIYVSTDNEIVEELALENGAQSLGLRNHKFANDVATTIEVVKYEIERIESLGLAIGNLCCIYPVTPLLRKERLIEGFSILSTIERGFVFPVQKSTKVQLKAMKIQNEIFSLLTEAQTTLRTQDQEEIFFDAGQFYWGSRNSWVYEKTIFASKSKVILFDKWETVDVDDPEDLSLVRVLFESRKPKEPSSEKV